MTRPVTLLELLERLSRRVRTLETRRTLSTGEWVIETDPAGNLVARHTQTGTVATIGIP